MSLFLMVSKQDYSGCLGKFNNYDSLGGGGNKRSSIFLNVCTFYSSLNLYFWLNYKQFKLFSQIANYWHIKTFQKFQKTDTNHSKITLKYYVYCLGVTKTADDSMTKQSP